MGKPVDRRPFLPVLSLYGAKVTGCSLEQYYRDPEAYAKGQVAVRELFAPDILCMPFIHGMLGGAFGSKLHYFADMPPNIRRPAISSVRQWEDLAIPDPDTHPDFLFLWEAIRQMKADHGDEIPIGLIVPGPSDIPALVMGLESWLETVLFEPEAAQRLVERLIPFYICLVNKAFETGAALAAMTHAFVSPAIVTREIVTSFSRPILMEILGQLKGPVVIHHTGAPFLTHLDLLTGLPGVVGFMIDQKDDLDQARRIVGSEMVLSTGINVVELAEISASEVEKRSRAMLESQRDERRLMLGNSGADITWQTPPENIHAIRRAIEAFGGTRI